MITPELPIMAERTDSFLENKLSAKSQSLKEKTAGDDFNSLLQKSENSGSIGPSHSHKAKNKPSLDHPKGKHKTPEANEPVVDGAMASMLMTSPAPVTSPSPTPETPRIEESPTDEILPTNPEASVLGESEMMGSADSTVAPDPALPTDTVDEAPAGLESDESTSQNPPTDETGESGPLKSVTGKPNPGHPEISNPDATLSDRNQILVPGLREHASERALERSRAAQTKIAEAETTEIVGDEGTTDLSSDFVENGNESSAPVSTSFPYEMEGRLKARGTSHAKPDAEMKKAEPMNQSALGKAQILPAGSSISSPLSEPPAKTLEAVEEMAESPDGTEGTPLNAPAVEGNFEAAEIVTEETSPVDFSSRVVETIEKEVMFMRQHKLESLSVMIRPESGLEISLHLMTRNGQVEAHAMCRNGAFDTLNREWTQLQQSLAAQGIRLAPLNDPGIVAFPSQGMMQFWSGSHHNENPHRDSAPQFAETFVPKNLTLPADSKATQPKAVTARLDSRGWETWA